jgi:AraC family transcriptional regulator, positive regulator of tynA and feaB
MKQWTTAGLPAAAQFESWHQVICNSFVPLRTELQQDGHSKGTRKGIRSSRGFKASLTSRETDELFFGEVAGQGQWVYRDAESIQRQDRPYYFLNIQRKGFATLEQSGRKTELMPESFALLDASQPFQMRVSDNFDQLSIKIPKTRLEPFLKRPEQLLAQRVQAQSGVGKIVVQALSAIAQEAESLDPRSAHLVINHALAMCGSAFNANCRNLAIRTESELLPDNAVEPRNLERLHRIRRYAIAYLEQHLHNPDLGVQQVAHQLGVSKRYIQMAFSATQDSVSHWILNQRLQRCHAELSAAQSAKQSVGELAYRYGFNDLSYFNRAFKQRFGVTPGACRGL